MNKIFMNRLTMLAVTLMASMACFAQGKLATGGPAPGKVVGDPVYFQGVEYVVTEVLSSSSVYKVKAVGFEPSLLADYNLMTDDLHNTLTIQHYLAPATANGVVTTWGFLVMSVETDAYAVNNVPTALAAKIETLVIDYKGDEKEVSDKGGANGVKLPTTGNTFIGLTALTEVDNFTPGAKVAAISANSFTNTVYQNAPLVVPSDMIGKYAQKGGWKKFLTIMDEGGVICGDLNNDDVVDLTDYTKLYNEVLKAEKTGNPITYSAAKDFNGDEEIDLTDATLLYNYLLSINSF